ncbi:MAG: FecR domain-containing protein [Pseudomonadota bacterium]
MPDAHQAKLIREATALFLRLRDDPDNADLREERDLFLARGDAEREAYAKMLKAWQVTETGKPSGPSALMIIAALSALIAGGYCAYDPVRVAMMSDVSTRYSTLEASLASGETVMLDAGSALADETDGQTRSSTLLKGTAFFDVETGERPFVVTAGEARVRATGTAFEAGHWTGGGRVTVTEGAVEVTFEEDIWQLQAGNELTWSEQTGVQLRTVDVDSSVGWRTDLLVADALTFADIAKVLERRLPGEIVITSAALRTRSIVGTFDLSDPNGTLALLADLTGAKIISIPSVVTVIRP